MSDQEHIALNGIRGLFNEYFQQTETQRELLLKQEKEYGIPRTGMIPLENLKKSVYDAINGNLLLDDGLVPEDPEASTVTIKGKAYIIERIKYNSILSKSPEPCIEGAQELVMLLLARESPFVKNLCNFYFTERENFFLTINLLMEESCQSLSAYLKSRTITENIIDFIVKCLVSILLWLEKHQIIHRDINFESLVVGSYDILKLKNFKLATFNTSIQNHKCGQHLFRAPEMIKGEIYDSSVDVWSSGVLLFILLFNRNPYNYSHANQEEFETLVCSNEPIEMPEIGNGLLRNLISRMLDKNAFMRIGCNYMGKEEINNHAYLQTNKNDTYGVFTDAYSVPATYQPNSLKSEDYGFNNFQEGLSNWSQFLASDHAERRPKGKKLMSYTKITGEAHVKHNKKTSEIDKILEELKDTLSKSGASQIKQYGEELSRGELNIPDERKIVLPQDYVESIKHNLAVLTELNPAKIEPVSLLSDETVETLNLVTYKGESYLLKSCQLESDSYRPADCLREMSILNDLGSSEFFQKIFGFFWSQKGNVMKINILLSPEVTSLAKLLESRWLTITIKILVFISICLVIILRDLRRKKIIHYNITPDNLLIDKNGYIILGNMARADYKIGFSGYSQSVKMTGDCIMNLAALGSISDPNLSGLIESMTRMPKEERISCGIDGINALLSHAFFAGVNWSDYETKRVTSPLLC